MIFIANKRVFKCFYSFYLKLIKLFLVAKMRGKIVLREIVRRLFRGVKQIFKQSLVIAIR